MNKQTKMTTDSIPTDLSMDKQQNNTENNIIITAKIIIETISVIVLCVIRF